MKYSRILPLAGIELALLGLLLGLFQYREVVRIPLQEYRRMSRFARPATTDWIAGLMTPAQMLDAFERPLLALVGLLVIAVCLTTAYILNPGFSLLKPPEQNPGSGASAHVELSTVRRTAVSLAISIWLLGFAAPLAAVLPLPRPMRAGAAVLFAGPPGWFDGLPLLVRIQLQSLLTGAAFWLVWGTWTRGFSSARRRWFDRLLLAILAGIAFFPAIYALYGARGIIGGSAQSISLARPLEWMALLQWALLLPGAGCLALLLPLYWIAAGTLTRGSLQRGVIGALAAACTAALLLAATNRLIARYDLDQPSLASLLRLPSSDQARYAVLLPPRPPGILSVTGDGSMNPASEDVIAANIETERAVERFLRTRNFSSRLAVRALIHLHDSAALDWDSDRQLELILRLAPHMPSEELMGLLKERLEIAPRSPRTVAVLRRFASAGAFRWNIPDGLKWQAALWRTLGETDEVRNLAPRLPPIGESDVAPEDPGPGGEVSGRALVMGKAAEGLRVGLAPVQYWARMAGACRPGAWRWVAQSAVTDSRGRFRFTGVRPGAYILALTGAGIGRHRGLPMSAPYPGLLRVESGSAAPLKLGTVDIYFMSTRPPDEEAGENLVAAAKGAARHTGKGSDAG